MTGNGVETGRIMPRRTYECHSCHVRNAIGVPWFGIMYFLVASIGMVRLIAVLFQVMVQR